eukprot:15087351-Ditylum_brightwellii.AAC.1
MVTIYKQVTDIPSGKDQTKSSNVNKEAHQCDKTKVKAYVTIISDLWHNTLKFESAVYAHLNKHNLYINPDLLMQNDAVSTGKLTCVHPKMVNRDDYITEINGFISVSAPPSNTVVHQWMVENKSTIDGMVSPGTDHYLSIATKSFGEDDKVKATTFNAVCKYKDVLYLKYIMATTWAQKHKPCSGFVPAGAELIMLPVMYKQLLCNHNTYVDSATGVIFEGLHPGVLGKEITVGDDCVTVQEYLLTKNKKIESTEQTKLSVEKGCWLFICKKKHANEVTDFLDRELQKVYQSTIQSSMRFKGMSTLQHTNHHAARSMGTYTELLS